MNRIYLLIVCLLTINCYGLDEKDSLIEFIEVTRNIKIELYLPFEGCPKSWLVHEAETGLYNDYGGSIRTLRDSGLVIESLRQARDRILAKLARAQEFRNHIHLVLSDLLANAEYDLKAKSPGDSDGISLDELRAIQEQIRKISVLSANNADLLQFMEGNGLDKLEASLKEELQVIPQASKSLIIEIINAYKSKTERYPLDLLKNGKLKVYLGVATSVSADAPAKPNLVSAEVQAESPSVRPKMQLKLSKSTAYGVPETPPVDTARADRFRAAIGNVFGTVLKNTSIVTDRNSLDPNAIIITTGDFALIKDSVSSAWAEVSSGSADDFMKKGSGQFAAIQMLDQYLKKIQPSITKKQNARKQLNLQRLSPSKGASNRGNPQQLTALDREIESLNGKIKALQAISAKVKKMFDDFKKQGVQSPSSVKIPQFVLVLDDQNSTTESAINGQTAAKIQLTSDKRSPLAVLPQNMIGQTPASEGKSGSPRTLREQREASQRLSDKGLNSVSGAQARVISGGQNIGHGEDLPSGQKNRLPTNHPNPQDGKGTPNPLFDQHKPY